MNIGQTIYKQWKVYRIVTVLKYFRESWVNSKFVLKKCPSKNRAFIYLVCYTGMFFTVMILMIIVLLRFGISLIENVRHIYHCEEMTF